MEVTVQQQREQKEQAKLQWLRKAAKEGFDQIDRGEGIEFQSMEQLDEEIDRLAKEASEELVSTHERHVFRYRPRALRGSRGL